MSVSDDLTESIKTGNRDLAGSATEQALAEEMAPEAVLDALIAGMSDVGERFKNGEAFVPEVLIAARAMNEAMTKLEPVLVEAGVQPVATAAIGTVQGDLHDIGKNLVAMMLKGANYKVVDLGVNVTADKFVAAVKEHGAQIVALSALLTTTMPSMKTTIDALREAGVEAKVLIGGAPVTQDFADEIGADGYAPDAATAVDVARRVVA